jgi:hypothetical protein
VACIDDLALFPVVLGGDSRCSLLVIFSGRFRDLTLGDLMWEICGNPSWFSLGCDSPSKSVSQGARFWWFRVSRVGGALEG